MLDDPSALERLLTSYLNPLSQSQENISKSPTKARPTSSIVFDSATQVINSVLNPSLSDASDTDRRLPYALVGKAFKCLHKQSHTLPRERRLRLIRNHEAYIIKLLDSKNYTEGGKELETLYNVLQDENSNEGSASVSRDMEWLQLGGISYTAKNRSQTPPTIVIAFNFLYLQYILQNLTLRIKSHAHTEGEMVGLLSQIVNLFASSSPFSQWLSISETKAKHEASILKQLYGIEKIVRHLSKKQLTNRDTDGAKSQDVPQGRLSRGSKVTLILSLKILQYSVRLDRPIENQNERIEAIKKYQSYSRDYSDDDLIKACITDLLTVLPTTHPVYGHLNVPERTSPDTSSFRSFHVNMAPSTSMSKSLTEEVVLHSASQLLNLPISHVTSIESLLQNYSSNLHVLQLLLHYISNSTTGPLSKSHLRYIDHISLQMKNTISALHGTSNDTNNTGEIIDLLSTLLALLSHHKNFKRLRNISNLFFNLAHKVPTKVKHSVVCWNSCITCELFICASDHESNLLTHLPILRMKVEKIANALYEIQLYEESGIILVKYLETIAKTSDYDDSTMHLNPLNQPLIIQMLAKNLLAENSISIAICDNTEITDRLRYTIYIEVIQFLEKLGKSQEITSVTNYLTENLKFGSKYYELAVAYHYYKLNGLTHYLDLEIMETDFLHEDSRHHLMLSEIYLQRTLKLGGDYSKVNHYVTSSIKSFNDWKLTKAENSYSACASHLKSLFTFLLCNEMIDELLQLKESAMQIGNLSQTDEIYLDSVQIGAYLSKLHTTDHFEDKINLLLKTSGESFKSMNLAKVNVQEVLHWKLAQFEYCIMCSKEEAHQLYVSITKFVTSKINIEDKRQSAEVKFSNLLLVSRFRYLCGKHFTSKSAINYCQAYENFRMAIKIIRSLLRRIGYVKLNDVHLQINVFAISIVIKAYYEIIRCMMKLGISNDLRYFLLEYEDTLESATWLSTEVRSVHLMRIANVYYYLQEPQRVVEISAIADGLKHDYLETNPCVCDDSVLNKLIVADVNSDTRQTANVSLQSLANDPNPRVLFKYLQSLTRVLDSDSDIGELNVAKDLYYSIIKSTISYKIAVRQVLMKNANDPTSTLLSAFGFFKNIFSIASSLKVLSPLELKDMAHYLVCCGMKLLHSGSVKLTHNYYENSSFFLRELFISQDYSKSLSFQNSKEIYRNFSDRFFPEISMDHQSENQIDIALDLSIIPKSWAVICIDYCEFTGKLSIFKYKNGKTFHIDLCLKRWIERGNDGIINFKEFQENFRSIIKHSNISTKREVTSKIKSKDQRRDWWKNRFLLDLRLKELLDGIEKSWLGGFKAMFDTTFDIEEFEKLQFQLCKIFKEETETEITDFNEEVVGLLISARSDVSDEQFDDILYYLFEGKGVSKKNFESIKMKMMGVIDKYGKILPQTKQDHIVLIPSTNCSFIPWESLSFLRGKSVSRMPSVKSLISTLNSNHNLSVIQNNIKESKVYFLINPEGDLSRTESNFGSNFTNSSDSWQGVLGKEPEESQLLSNLLKSDLFIYLGHGGCEQYIRTSDMLRLTSANGNACGARLPPSLLIGCSSGALQLNGLLEPSGNVYNWLTAGSSMLLVNLWDVTDKDIDAFSQSVFKKWGLFKDGSRPVNICEAVDESRDSCVLKYLNGCSPVVYGLPLHLESLN